MSILNENNKFSKIYYENCQFLLRYAQTILPRAEAEDVVQETFVRLYKNLHKVDENECSKTRQFLVITLKRVAYTVYRKNQRHNGDADIDETEIPSSFDPTWEEISFQMMHYKLKTLIDELPEEDKVLLVLRSVKGCSYKEISTIVGISEKNVSVRLTRIREKLKIALSE